MDGEMQAILLRRAKAAAQKEEQQQPPFSLGCAVHAAIRAAPEPGFIGCSEHYERMGHNTQQQLWSDEDRNTAMKEVSKPSTIVHIHGYPMNIANPSGQTRMENNGLRKKKSGDVLFTRSPKGPTHGLTPLNFLTLFIAAHLAVRQLRRISQHE